MTDDDIAAISARLRMAWAAIIDAEHGRGAAMDDGAGAAQEAYQAALTLFRQAQIEAFTATLGVIPLLQAQIAELEARLDTLERAVGERQP
jgi:alkylation response protein AidB-like acyl-CoA dehydrogenase